MSDYSDLIPVNVLTGALGAGKTTLLTRLLEDPNIGEVAVLVNELGEVGIDHHLVEHASESTLLLENGCICCSMREDLNASLRELFSRRERGEIPPFTRVVVETSGIADPVPIAYTLLTEPVLQHHYRLGNVVTVVDAVNAEQQLKQFEAYVKQIALADRLLVSKSDLADPAVLKPLQRTLGRLNAGASIEVMGCSTTSAGGQLNPVDLLIADSFDPLAKRGDVEAWLRRTDGISESARLAHASDQGVTAHCFTYPEPIDWTAFGVWMTMLLHRHGDRILRIKGLLNVQDVPGPVLINGVQHIVHPPAHLECWPDVDRSSRVVVIVSDIDRETLTQSLSCFNRLVHGFDC